jgi:starvation-inducible DNA-binding protein
MRYSELEGYRVKIQIGIEEKVRKETAQGLFETQYNELALAIDLIAERIRTLGFPALGSYRHFNQLTSIKETESSASAREMIYQLAEGRESVIRTARTLLPLQRIQTHEKNSMDAQKPLS